jgi:hypothetical protein
MYEDISARKKFSASLNEVNKLKLTNKKLREIQDRTQQTVDFHRSEFMQKVDKSIIQ